MAIIQKKKVCKGCGEETYIFSKGLCKVCSVRSKALLYRSGSLSQLKGDRSKYGVRRKLRIDFNAPLEVLEKYSLSFLKRVCDFWFRRYLLGRAVLDSNGKIYCIVTEKWIQPEYIHVCHYIDRVVASTRYSEDNCVLCSAESNIGEANIMDDTREFKSLHHRKFAAALLKKDPEKIKKIELLSKQSVVYKKQDYIDMVIKFRE